MTVRLASFSCIICLILAIALPAGAETPTANELFARMSTGRPTTSYELRADFSGTLTLAFRGAEYKAEMTGSFKELSKAGEARQRKATVSQIHLPVLLRPFARTFGGIVEQGIETQPEDPTTFDNQDTFILEAQAGNRYRVAGVRRDIVNEALERYMPRAGKQDQATRQAVAKWLFTSPTMRGWIQRSGPPYAFVATIGEDGLLHELTVFYDWGQLGNRIDYVVVNDQPVWRELVSDVLGEVPGVGFMNGKLIVTFANHCINCR